MTARAGCCPTAHHWLVARQRSRLEPMPAEFEQLATVISMKTGRPHRAGQWGPGQLQRNVEFHEPGTERRNRKEGAAGMMQSRRVLPASPTGTVGNSLMQASHLAQSGAATISTRATTRARAPQARCDMMPSEQGRCGGFQTDRSGAGFSGESIKRGSEKLMRKSEKKRRECIEDWKNLI